MNFAKIGGLLELLELLEHKTMKCVANYLHNANSCRFVLRLRCGATCPRFVIILGLLSPFFILNRPPRPSYSNECTVDWGRYPGSGVVVFWFYHNQAGENNWNYVLGNFSTAETATTLTWWISKQSKSMTYFYFPSELTVTGSQRKVRVHWLHLNLQWWYYTDIGWTQHLVL